ncbi:MAG: BTAD domain-containing putative transcriptional regulator [Bacillota bacterium]|nr:BTAD domain-containing putative transcriptional regulator [Bacillota bacterium]
MKDNKIQINMLGSPKITYNGTDITDKLSYKSAGILYYVSANNCSSREKIAYTFWEGSSEDAAKYNLRYNLWSMNKIFKSSNKDDEPILEWNKNNLFLNENYEVDIDIKKYSNELKSEDLDLISLIKLKSLYKGEFLEGFYLKDSFSFNDWLFFEREKYQKKHIQVLKNLLTIYKKEKKYDKSISVLKEMLNINSLDEDLYVELIKVYLEMGDRANALIIYNKCIHVLRQELNISPKKSTEKLLKIIKNKNYQTSYKSTNTSGDIVRLEQDDLDYLLKNKAQYGNVLTVKCIPIENLNYCFMASLIDKIIDFYPKDFLMEARPGIWNDIYRINTRAAEFIIKNFSFTSTETERNRLYYSLLELIRYITKDKKTLIISKDIQFIDKYSFDFIKFLLFKKDDLNLEIMFTSNNDNNYLIEIEQYFNLSKFTK